MLAGEVHSVWQEGARHVLIFPKSIAVGEQDRSVDRQDTLCEIASAEIARGELQSEGASPKHAELLAQVFQDPEKTQDVSNGFQALGDGTCMAGGLFSFRTVFCLGFVL